MDKERVGGRFARNILESIKPQPPSKPPAPSSTL